METIDILQILGFIVGLVLTVIKTLSVIKKGFDTQAAESKASFDTQAAATKAAFETQRKENRSDHGKIFDTLADLAGTAIKHEEKLFADRRDINKLENDVEIVETKRQKVDDNVRKLELELVKISR